MEFLFLVGKQVHKISIEKTENGFLAKTGRKTFEADIQPISSHIISIKAGDRIHRVFLARDRGQYHVQLEGQQFLLQEPDREAKVFSAQEGKLKEEMLLIKAPMPGKVIKINVAEKETVRKNQTLAIVEAMKMENEIKSDIDGMVKKIFVSVGDLVDADKSLLELEK